MDVLAQYLKLSVFLVHWAPKVIVTGVPEAKLPLQDWTKGVPTWAFQIEV